MKSTVFEKNYYICKFKQLKLTQKNYILDYRYFETKSIGNTDKSIT